MARSLFILCFGTALCGGIVAHPAPEPKITPTPTTPAKRDLLDVPASITSILGSAIPSDAAGGILPAWLTMPSDDQIKEQLGLNDTEISQLPVEVMNIPCVLFIRRLSTISNTLIEAMRTGLKMAGTIGYMVTSTRTHQRLPTN
jgi:hypothetical protein